MYKRIVEELDSKPKQNKTELSIGALAGPQYTSNIGSDGKAENVGISSEGLLAYTGGMSVQLKPWRRLSLETGVFYMKQGSQTEVNAPMNLSQDYVTLNNTSSGWERLDYEDAMFESANLYNQESSEVLYSKSEII